AIGVIASHNLKVVRFGDNMRYVAVTEGDKVEAEIKLGWSVNTFGVGDLVDRINNVAESQVAQMYDEYLDRYELATTDIHSIKEQIKYEIALRSIFDEYGFGAFTNTF